ncbi:MAG: DNA cytosine methyltransferase [Egibacteraceae bacterium]
MPRSGCTEHPEGQREVADGCVLDAPPLQTQGIAHQHIDNFLSITGGQAPSVDPRLGRSLLGAPTSLELFAGGGGLALGLHGAGFRHRALVEFEPKACATLRGNAERWAAVGGRTVSWAMEEIVEADARDYLRSDVFRDLGRIDLLAGGPPCQPFSLGGVHAGVNDSRNMFPAALDYVRELWPKVVVFENVPGLTRPSFLPYFEYIEAQLRWPSVTPRTDEPWLEHARRLSSRTTGPLDRRYRVTRQVINAADLGVPQVRRRVFLLAVRADMRATPMPAVPLTHSADTLLYEQWVEPTYWDEHGIGQPPLPSHLSSESLLQLKLDGWPEDRQRWRTVRDALRGLPAPVDGQPHSDILNHIGVPGARSYAGHTGSRLDWPAKTLKAGVHGVCGGEAMLRQDDGSLRYFTVRESARIQTFSDDYEFVGARSHAMRQIGNAVAVEVGRAVGEHIRRQVSL